MDRTRSRQRPRPIAGPSFLIGPTLYLRGIERDDAGTMAAWHPSPFPIPSDLAEERLNDEVPDEAELGAHRLIACRRADDRPVGSIAYATDDLHAPWLAIHVDPALGDAGGALRAELLKIVVPWLLHEREFMSVWIEAPAGDRAIAAAAAELGMRSAFRMREAAWHHGARQDLIGYEALHPRWVERLRMPPLPAEGEVERAVKAPAPPRWTGEVPENAFAVGERLYLRPLEQADAEELARWSTRETDAFHDIGRHIRSPISYWQWNRKLAEERSPTWIRFAIVAKEGDLVIGSNGLTDLDWIARTAESETDIVRPDYRGAGYGTEAKHLLLEYAFVRLGLHMVRSVAWAFNTRSCDALIKQGYRIAGGLSWTGVKNAEFVNDLLFDLLASEWAASRR
jgi:RimJ/RimL family protein N-acetyltransferase